MIYDTAFQRWDGGGGGGGGELDSWTSCWTFAWLVWVQFLQVSAGPAFLTVIPIPCRFDHQPLARAKETVCPHFAENLLSGRLTPLIIVIRPSLKKSVFPVQRPGEYFLATTTFFFLFFLFWHFSFLFFFFCSKNDSNFLQKEKRREKKKILRLLDLPQFWPPAGQETNLFLRVASGLVIELYQDSM